MLAVSPPHVPNAAPVAPTAPARRRVDVQGLRAVAVLLVIVYHAKLNIPGGFVGVDVFFVISGFVITQVLFRELESTGRLDLKTFYLRRTRRLLPALAAVVAIVVLASLALLSPLGTQQSAAQTGIAASVFSANAQLFLTPSGYFAPSAATNPLLHTWSLAVEEQFYLVFPAFLILVWRLSCSPRLRRRGPRFTVGVALAALGLCSFLISYLMSFQIGLPKVDKVESFAFYPSPTRAWEFAMGAVVALASPLLSRAPKALLLSGGLVGAGLVVAAAGWLDAGVPFPGTAALLPVIGAAMIIASGARPGRGVSRFLEMKPLPWIGDLSYSWYLWHWPAISFADLLSPPDAPWLVPLAAAASLLPAWASARWIEAPFRFSPRFAGRRALKVGFACVSLPLILSAALLGSGTVATGEVRAIRGQLGLHLDVKRECQGNLPDAPGSERCRWSTPRPKGEVVLVGDSNAGQLTEGMILASAGERRDFTVATLAACPFLLDVVVVSDGYFDADDCQRFVRSWITAIERRQPDLVVIASATSDYFLSEPRTGFQRRTGGPVAYSAAEKAALVEDGLAFVLRRLDRAGVQSLVVPTLPHFVDWGLESCPAYRLYADADSCGRKTPLAEIRAEQALAAIAERRAARGVSTASTVDLTPFVCESGTCATNFGDRWVNRDGGHITVGMSKRLARPLGAALRRHLE